MRDRDQTALIQQSALLLLQDLDRSSQEPVWKILGASVLAGMLLIAAGMLFAKFVLAGGACLMR